jgi:ketosteroid isomerase-like protein
LTTPSRWRRKNYRAYVDKDRAAIEQLIAPDFHFSSPLDNRIDRQTYCARCWPNSACLRDFKLVHLVEDGNRVFVTYEGSSDRGNAFRNTEILTVRDGKIVDVEVYFGWSIPHDAPAGGFKNPPNQG